MNSKCALCNIKCNVIRELNTGFCGIDDKLHISHYGLHHGEEPFLSSFGGSGTIFFSGCTLRCRFCQNYQISRLRFDGKKNNFTEKNEYSAKELTNIFFELKKMGARNINFVSPTPYVPFILEAVKEAKLAGFDLPFVYNSHGNDSLETIDRLYGIIDIYLPDMKYGNDETGFNFSGVKNLYSNAKNVIKRMYEQSGRLELDSNGVAIRGVAIRHLVLPGEIENSLSVIDFLESIDRKMYLSLMSQFHPNTSADLTYPNLGRLLSADEYNRIVSYATALGFENMLVQEMESSSEYLPDFNRRNVFK